MSLFSKGFYRYSARDFVIVLAGSLQVGDLISLAGPGNSYGVARIEYITDCMGRGQLICVNYTLPNEARISNNKDTDIDVSWDGKQHVIKVSVYKDAAREVMVLAEGNRDAGVYDDYYDEARRHVAERSERRLGRY